MDTGNCDRIAGRLIIRVGSVRFVSKSIPMNWFELRFWFASVPVHDGSGSVHAAIRNACCMHGGWEEGVRVAVGGRGGTGRQRWAGGGRGWQGEVEGR